MTVSLWDTQALSSNIKWTSLKIFLLFLFTLSLLYGDRIKQKTLGCPSVMLLQKAPKDTGDNYIELNMYAIANSCIILSRRDSIKAIGYNPANSENLFVKILYKKTNTTLYIPRFAIEIEQGGKENSFRF